MCGGDISDPPARRLRIDPACGHDLSRRPTVGKTGAAAVISRDRDGSLRPATPRGWDLRALLKLSSGIDWLNEKFGVVANWLVLLACVISAGNAASRYLFSESSNGWLEVQWYMFAGMVLLGGPYTLKMNEHVRVDLIYGMVSEKTRIWIDIVCGVLFLLPICAILVYFTWPWFVESWRLGEESSNAGGLIRWPVKLVLPVGFALMVLQGISELIKRVAALEHVIEADFKYEKPLQ
jgi:TRAP-type mannitol/chloroaromatic compound transport system permease small subunit